MYRFKLAELKLYIDDPENNQHKIVVLKKPLVRDTLEGILDFIQERAEVLHWLPNDIQDDGVIIDTREFKRLRVDYET